MVTLTDPCPLQCRLDTEELTQNNPVTSPGTTASQHLTKQSTMVQTTAKQSTMVQTTAKQSTMVQTTAKQSTKKETFGEFTCLFVKGKKPSSYIAQYPVLRTVQSDLHFTSMTDLFTQTPSRLLWEASSHMLQLMREGCSYTYPPLSIAKYSFIQLSELEQCRVNKLAQRLNTAAQDSKPGSRSRESEALPLSHYTLLYFICVECHRVTATMASVEGKYIFNTRVVISMAA